ncbi:MAG TPA: undecaprenyl-diphosphate phosphatase [Candidatus Eisenbergiella merdipullorum]|uniref:Undecaprenyl-diphosphatase n=1 Tax=Candidatus Eisenbergiella merdipullorum TaxID=2838553 RepID=A0A9D2I5F6_9FIRM|nr:undecaprenyl-diphosphate phosphatase [Candidatus Eisenbergiella merdipullorum]
MIEILKAVLFGIVEGITEWLPISSTGHMILLDEFVTLDVSSEFWDVFLVVIQLGAIFAVVVLFWNKIFPFDFSARGRKKGIIRKDIFQMWFKVIVACVPAMIYGVLLDDLISPYLYNATVVAIMLILFGIAFIVIENWNRGRKPRVKKMEALTYRDALIIGLFQLIAAIFPGTSRSGATIVGALLIGVSRTVSAEFTFFLAIPVMFGASLLKLVKFGFAFTGSEIILLLVGMVSAFVVSMLVISFLMGYIRKHDFKVFGWYRIVLGILVLFYFYAIA